MIISLYLRNFRRFEEVQADFSAGVNGIFGANYKGKSTLLLAIAVAIAGPSWARGYRLARRGTDNFEIQLVLQIGDAQYRVLRSKSGAKLFRLVPKGEDKLMASQQGNVNIELGRLLGMPVDRWLQLRYVRQKQAASMFESGSTALNLMVEELTGVRTITNVIESMVTKQKKVQVEADTLRTQLLTEEALAERRTEAEGYTAEATRLQTELDELAVQVPALKQSTADRQVEIREARAEVSTQRTLANRKRDVQRDLANAQAELKDLPESTGKLAAEWDAESDRQTEAERDLRTARMALANATKQVDGAKPKADSTKAALKVAEAALEAAPLPAEQLDSYEEDGKAWETRRAELAAEQKATKTAIAETHAAIDAGICGSCKRPFEADKAHADALDKKLTNLRAEELTLADQIREHGEAGKALAARGEQIEAQVTAHNAAERALDKARTAATSAAQELENATTLLKAAGVGANGRTVEQLDEAIEACTTARKHADSQSKKEHTREASEARLNTQIAKAQASLAGPELSNVLGDEKLQAMEDEIEALQAKQTEESNTLASLSTIQGNNARQRESFLKMASNIEAGLTQQEQLRLDVDTKDHWLEVSKAFVKYLRDNRSRYLANAWELILGRASAFANDVTAGHITELRRTEDGAFVFIEENEEAIVTDSSGAQAAILGIGVQVALAETLPTALDLFMVDEPAADMDAEHSSACLLGISAVSKQALVISHHRMDEALCAEVMEL